MLEASGGWMNCDSGVGEAAGRTLIDEHGAA
jgi:hypothetical protein